MIIHFCNTILDVSVHVSVYVCVTMQQHISLAYVYKLFKMYWVCNVEYPAQLTSVFNFFENVYDIPFTGGKRSKVVELISKLQALS